MKKILFLHPDLRGGGAEKVLVNMLNRLDKVKYDITLTTIFEEGVNKEILSPEVKHNFLLKKVFPGWSLLQKIFSPSFLFNRIVKGNYDIIVAYLEGVPTRIVGGCSSKNTKIISWVHVDLEGFNIEKVFRSPKEMRNLYLKYNAIVGVSKTALNSLSKKIPQIPKNKLKVIHNVVDVNLIIAKGNEIVEEIDFNKKTINLCSVGRLAQQKGYIRLLNALALLAKEGIPFHLYIVGQGEQEEKLKEIIAKNQLESQITLLGFKSNPHKYVNNCDLFVCSSYQEGFSTAVTESVLLKTPVLTTNCAGMDEILVDGKYGMIVENTDEALLGGLRKILTTPSLLNHYKEKVNERSQYLQEKDNIADIEKLFHSITQQQA
ncbi:glycosyltransferase [Flavobacteriaceae bacterium SZ-1-7]|uniref:glycosyltransferase n=1 Tax=Tamlana sedimenti TaxID=3134126 RepID=UPI00312527F3